MSFVSALLSACSAIQPANRVQIANGITLQLLLPTQSATVTQKITATYKKDKHVLIMQVEATPQQIIMAGLAPTGTRLFSLMFDGTHIESWKSPLFQAPFDGTYVLADYELAALDVAVLRSALPKQVTLEETESDGIKTRLLKNTEGKTVIRMEYEKNKTQYCHLEREYCLLIENL
jgi:hypothetical protein